MGWRTFSCCVLSAICARALVSCAVLPPVEVAWQGLNVIDAVQTLEIAREPGRYSERVSAWAVGAHPSERSVLGYMATCAVAHALVGSWLQDSKPGVWRVFEGVSLGLKARNVVWNYHIGLR